MSQKLTMKVGDLAPSIKWALGDTSLDLTGAAVVFSMTAPDGTPKITDAAGIVETATVTPTVAYDWQGTDTDTVGEYRCDFKITLAGVPFHTPGASFIIVEIIEDA